jgi:hypothetical protein
MLNLFGEYIPPEKQKTREQEYAEYISSAKWRRLRDEKIKSTGGLCERCGISKYSVALEVHHLNYKTFKRERFEDLQVLCKKCHELADMERQTLDDLEKKAHQQKSSLYIGFISWLRRGNKPPDQLTSSEAWESKKRFLTLLYRNQKRKYKLNLGVFGYHDQDIDWTPE